MYLAEFLQSYVTILFGVAGGILLVLWLAVLAWVFKDIRSRSRSGSAALFAVLIVGLLPAIGLAVYLLLRPRLTLIDVYDRALEQEALLQQIEDKSVCPTCGKPTHPDWVLCPSCHTHLRQPCPACNSPLELTWDICPWCGCLPAVLEEAVSE